MQEAFRRSFRKFTGKSVVNLKGNQQRFEMLERLGMEFDPNYTILLRENLEDFQKSQHTSSEIISEAQETHQKSARDFKLLEADLSKQFYDFRQKWGQRFEVESFAQKLLTLGYLTLDEGSYKFQIGSSAKDVKDFYLQDMHLMVGDAEKLVVTTCSRCLKLQNQICKEWYTVMASRSDVEGSLRPISKILPTLELGLREMEDREIRKIRDSIKLLTEKRFRDGVKKTSKRKFSTPEAAFKNIGAEWNSLGVWNSGFRSFMEDFVDFCMGICAEIIEWYHKKWNLYTRGWSTGQIQLFE